MDSGSLGGVAPPWRQDLGDSVASEARLPAVCVRVSAGFDDAVVVWAGQDQVVQGDGATGPPHSWGGGLGVLMGEQDGVDPVGVLLGTPRQRWGQNGCGVDGGPISRELIC